MVVEIPLSGQPRWVDYPRGEFRLKTISRSGIESSHNFPLFLNNLLESLFVLFVVKKTPKEGMRAVLFTVRCHHYCNLAKLQKTQPTFKMYGNMFFCFCGISKACLCCHCM